jgi:hypothetical protein
VLMGLEPPEAGMHDEWNITTSHGRGKLRAL